ncbi:unnamed protein product [Ranitomeya imitator]|uniref:Helix-turn-helix domain-containing protein n=1 Tax=Ranitomeya imitator TaxID=111125 RepID=A0ABN9L5B7_9NEOB|nr:unnamed protein product [Ranitomeya imitator]
MQRKLQISSLSLNCPVISSLYPPREIRGRDLERELRSLVNLELHCATLTEYLRVQRIPRGLRVPLRPTLFRDSPEFCVKFEHILNKCSLDLITLTVEHLQRALSNNSEKIKSIEAQLSTTGTPEELTSLKTEIQDRINRHKRDIETIKRNKFARDAEDYRNNRAHVVTPERKPDGDRDPRRNQELNRITRSKDSFFSFKEDVVRGTLFYPPNLLVEERHSLRNLQDDKSIIIKPADKGGALVIMDKNMYISEIMRQLSDASIYKGSITHRIHQDIEVILRKYTNLGVLDQKTCEFSDESQPPPPITPVFYTLPKIHKNLENPPGRPIVASTDSLLSPLARYLEKILTPLIKGSKSFLLDTGSFLHLIREIHQVPSEALLVTLDVRDLYTSIPHTDGVDSARRLLEGAEMDPEQVRGTAMGSHAAPPYANAYMIDFSRKASFIKIPSSGSCDPLEKIHRRCVFASGMGLLNLLIISLPSSMSPWPGFEFLLSTQTVNSLLHFDSLHPPSTKRSIPRAQYQRVQRIVSNTETRESRIEGMTRKFQARGYPLALLENSRTVSNTPPGETTRDVSHLYMGFIQFKQPFLPCFKKKRAPNLRDTLVKADIGTSTVTRQLFLNTPRKGTFPCLHCAQCNNVLKGDTITHPRSGKEYKIHGFFTCNSSYVVYVLKCPCGLLYVGETSQSIRDRVSKHKSTIRCNNLLLPIPHHFAAAGHNISQLKFSDFRTATDESPKGLKRFLCY